MAVAETVVPFEVPEQMRAFAEKGVAQARDSYAKFKDAAESSNTAIEAVVTAATKGANDYTSKMLELVRTNTHASFDFAQELASVKSPTQFFEVWSGFARKQAEALSAQTKELAEIVQKTAAETSEPLKATASKLFTPTA
jgi:phasin